MGPTRMRSAVLAIVLAFAGTGCSSVQLAYNTADFFIERYADEYLGLDSTQMQRWSPVLQAALERHRAEELPYLVSFFSQAAQNARRGFTRTSIDCLLDQFETIYRRHFRLASSAAAPLLANLSPGQIDALAERFAVEDEQDAAEATAEGAARRARKRAERYADNMRWWFGDLNSEQRGLVRDVTRRIPDTAPTWYRYRAMKRSELIALLRNDAAEAAIERFMVDWLVDYRRLPNSLADAQPALRNAFADLVLRLQPTFSDQQRQRFIGRLEGLRRDFIRLQQRPTIVPIPCTAG